MTTDAAPDFRPLPRPRTQERFLPCLSCGAPVLRAGESAYCGICASRMSLEAGPLVFVPWSILRPWRSP
jgi:hypothetical protein